MQPALCKSSANERKESLLSVFRVQPALCKSSANERKESLLSIFRVQPALCKYRVNLPIRQVKQNVFLLFRHSECRFEKKPYYQIVTYRAVLLQPLFSLFFTF